MMMTSIGRHIDLGASKLNCDCFGGGEMEWTVVREESLKEEVLIMVHRFLARESGRMLVSLP